MKVTDIEAIEQFLRSELEDTNWKKSMTYRQQMLKLTQQFVQQYKPKQQGTKLFDRIKELYDQFLQSRGLPGIDMTGYNAKKNSQAISELIRYFTEASKKRGKDGSSEEVFRAFQYLFQFWDQQSQFNRSRLELWDIKHNINERIEQIRNGYNKASKQLSESEQRRRKLQGGR